MPLTRKDGLMRPFRAQLIVLILTATTSCLHRPQSFVDKGNSLLAQAKYDDAVLQYRKALQKDPMYGEGHFGLGKALLKQGHLSEAYDHFVTADQVLPGRDDIKIQMGDLAVSFLLRLDTHPKIFYDQVAALRDYFLSRNPSSYDGLRWKGYLEVLDRKPLQAIESFTRGLQVKPDDALLNANLVDTLWQAGKVAEAEKLGKEQLGKHPDNLELYDVLYKHYRTSARLTDAEALLKKKVLTF